MFFCQLFWYRELCCKTCEDWRPDNQRALLEQDKSIPLSFTDGEDFELDEDDDINELDYDSISDSVDDMLNLEDFDIDADDLTEFDKDFKKVTGEDV